MPGKQGKQGKRGGYGKPKGRVKPGTPKDRRLKGNK